MSGQRVSYFRRLVRIFTGFSNLACTWHRDERRHRQRVAGSRNSSSDPAYRSTSHCSLHTLQQQSKEQNIRNFIKLFNLQMTNLNQRETLGLFVSPNTWKNVRTVIELPSGVLKTLEPFLSQIAAVFNSLRPTSNNLEYDCTPQDGTDFSNFLGDMFNYLPPSSHIRCCRSDPRSGAFMTPDTGSDPGSQTYIFESLMTIFG